MSKKNMSLLGALILVMLIVVVIPTGHVLAGRDGGAFEPPPPPDPTPVPFQPTAVPNTPATAVHTEAAPAAIEWVTAGQVTYCSAVGAHDTVTGAVCSQWCAVNGSPAWVMPVVAGGPSGCNYVAVAGGTSAPTNTAQCSPGETNVSMGIEYQCVNGQWGNPQAAAVDSTTATQPLVPYLLPWEYGTISGQGALPASIAIMGTTTYNVPQTALIVITVSVGGSAIYYAADAALAPVAEDIVYGIQGLNSWWRAQNAPAPAPLPQIATAPIIYTWHEGQSVTVANFGNGDSVVGNLYHNDCPEMPNGDRWARLWATFQGFTAHSDCFDPESPASLSHAISQLWHQLFG